MFDLSDSWRIFGVHKLQRLRIFETVPFKHGPVGLPGISGSILIHPGEPVPGTLLFAVFIEIQGPISIVLPFLTSDI